jgi:hypothetical protein
MAETEAGGSIVGSIIEMVGRFADVATGSPEQAILLAVGALITLFAAGLFGLLAAGAALDWVASLAPSGGGQPRRG